MPCNHEIAEEINMLIRFSQTSTLQGIKVHANADTNVIGATTRLFDKGLVSQQDGGYLTPLGHEAADQAHSLLNILTPPKPAA